MAKIRRVLLLIALVVLPPSAAAFAQTSTPAPTATPDYRTFIPVGSVQLVAGYVDVAAGWLVCDGSAISRTTYVNLYNAIGTTYGAGDGSTTFNLPDLRGRTAIGEGTGTGLTSRSIGQLLGEENHTLTVTEMPSHSHGVTDPGHSHVPPAGFGTFFGLRSPLSGGTNSGAAGTTYGVYNNTASSTTGITINNTGGGAAFNVMQPSTVLHYVIWTGAVAMPSIVAEETIVITVVVVFPTHTPTPTPTPTYTPTPGSTPTPTPTASPTVSTSVSYSVGSQAVNMDYTVRPGDAMTVGLLMVIATFMVVLAYMYFKRGG